MVLIVSVNVNGLRNIKKRQNVWKCKSLSSYGTNLSKGVTVLFHEKAIINILSYNIHEDGRMISVKIEIYDQKLQIINIYAPNNPVDRKRFIKQLGGVTDETYLQVFAGYFNCVLEGTLDRLSRCNTRDQGYFELFDLINQFNLDDLFRKRFPNKQAFTFSRGSSKIKNRSISNIMLVGLSCKNTSVLHFPFSDHDAISLEIDLTKKLRGPGTGKMNVNTIQSQVFRECIDNLWPCWASEINVYKTPIFWWEMVKYRIKQLTIEITKSFNISKTKFKKLENRLNEVKDSENALHKNECIYLKKKIKEYYERQLETLK